MESLTLKRGQYEGEHLAVVVSETKNRKRTTRCERFRAFNVKADRLVKHVLYLGRGFQARKM